LLKQQNKNENNLTPKRKRFTRPKKKMTHYIKSLFGFSGDQNNLDTEDEGSSTEDEGSSTEDEGSGSEDGEYDEAVPMETDENNETTIIPRYVNKFKGREYNVDRTNFFEYSPYDENKNVVREVSLYKPKCLPGGPKPTLSRDAIADEYYKNFVWALAYTRQAIDADNQDEVSAAIRLANANPNLKKETEYGREAEQTCQLIGTLGTNPNAVSQSNVSEQVYAERENSMYECAIVGPAVEINGEKTFQNKSFELKREEGLVGVVSAFTDARSTKQLLIQCQSYATARIYAQQLLGGWIDSFYMYLEEYNESGDWNKRCDSGKYTDDCQDQQEQEEGEFDKSKELYTQWYVSPKVTGIYSRQYEENFDFDDSYVEPFSLPRPSLGALADAIANDYQTVPQPETRPPVPDDLPFLPFGVTLSERGKDVLLAFRYNPYPAGERIKISCWNATQLYVIVQVPEDWANPSEETRPAQRYYAYTACKVAGPEFIRIPFYFIAKCIRAARQGEELSRYINHSKRMKPIHKNMWKIPAYV
jgi:hypothetical protein